MEPVALGVQQPNFINTLSGLMQLRQQQQNLARGAAETQMTQQTAKQRANLANIDWDKHMGDDGTLDLNSFIKDNDIRKAAGDAYPDLIQQASAIKSTQLDAKSRLLSLNKDQIGAYASMLGGLANDDDVQAGNEAGKAKTKAAFTAFAQTYGMDAAKAVAPIALPLMNDQIPADKLGKMVQHVQMQAQDTSRQLELMRPQEAMVQGPQGLQPVNVNAYAPGGIGPNAKSIEQGIAPGTATSPTTGGLYVLGPNGQVRPVTPQGGAGNGGQSFNPTYQGQAQDVESFRNEVNNIRQAGDQAPLARNINQQILRLSNDAKTGPGTQAWQHALGAVGAPFGLSPSASYQEVGKFLEKNAIANMQSMGGPPSDARLSAAAAANGSTSFSKEALQKVTKFNDATTTALAQYRQGIDHAIGMGQNANYLNLPQFKAAWAKNFDVDVFRVENAIRDGDTKELAQIKQELGPKRLKELAQKRAALTALSNGQMP